jgi:hypothetical protein
MGALENAPSPRPLLIKFRSYARTPNGRHVLWYLVLLLQFVLALWMGYRLCSVLLGVGESAKKHTNTFCLDNRDYGITSETGTILNGNFTGPCAYEYNFKKAIYFWVDGVSWDTADSVFGEFPDTNIFKIKHKQNPWSAWVFATIMTGKPNRNMGVIRNDNLIHQFTLAGMKTTLSVEESQAYVGYALDEFVEEESPAVTFNPAVTNDDDAKPPQMFDWFFRCDDNTGLDVEYCVNKILDELAFEERSMFLESFYLDHQVHFGAYNKYTDQIYKILAQYVDNMKLVKKWIDAHPDYLLVVISDHGQKTTDEEAGIHGDFTREGNEGWIMFYNPNIDKVISQPSSPVTLSTVDVHPTIWQFFSAQGASIAAENVGAVYPISYDARVQYNMLKTNAEQMIEYTNRANIYKVSPNDFMEARGAEFDGDYEKGVVEMREFVDNLSQKIQDNYMDIRPLPAAIIGVVALVLSLALQFGFSKEGYSAAIRYVGLGVIASVYITWILVAFLFENPTSQTTKTDVLAYAVSLFAFIAAYISRNLPPQGEKQKKGFTELPTDDTESGTELSSRLSIALSIDGDSDDYILDEKPAQSKAPLCESNEIASSKPILNGSGNEFVYLRVWDHIKEKRHFHAVGVFFRYLFGAYKVNPSTPENWLMYFIVAFTSLAGAILAYSNKRFIVSNVDVLYKHPLFVEILGLVILSLEFRWQRIELTSKLNIPHVNTESMRTQILHPSFWPLNFKILVYYAIFLISYQNDHLGLGIGFSLYAFLFAHIAILVFCSAHIQRDLALPVFALLFLLEGTQERILMSLYFYTMHFISCSLEKKIHARRHILPAVLFTMIMITHFYFAILGKSVYELSEVTVTIPGLEDPTKYPLFSVAIMGIHYFGIFLMIVPFIIRLVTPTPALQPRTIKGITFGHTAVPRASPFPPKDTIRKLTSSILQYFSASAVAFFYFYVLMRSLSDSCVVWAGTVVLASVLYSLTLVTSEFPNVILLVLRK